MEEFKKNVTPFKPGFKDVVARKNEPLHSFFHSAGMWLTPYTSSHVQSTTQSKFWCLRGHDYFLSYNNEMAFKRDVERPMTVNDFVPYLWSAYRERKYLPKLWMAQEDLH